MNNRNRRWQVVMERERMTAQGVILVAVVIVSAVLLLLALSS